MSMITDLRQLNGFFELNIDLQSRLHNFREHDFRIKLSHFSCLLEVSQIEFSLMICNLHAPSGELAYIKRLTFSPRLVHLVSFPIKVLISGALGAGLFHLQRRGSLMQTSFKLIELSKLQQTEEIPL